MNKLPNEIINKTMLLNSHPVADLLKASNILKFYKYKLEREHGCPFDRGSMDAYYYRDMSPHYWTNGNGQDGGRVEHEQMTDSEIEAYILGYENEDDREKV